MIVFTKQNRVIRKLEAERQKCKREARLESKPVPIIKDSVEQKNKINNNIAAKPEVKPAAKEKTSVPAAAAAPLKGAPGPTVSPTPVPPAPGVVSKATAPPTPAAPAADPFRLP